MYQQASKRMYSLKRKAACKRKKSEADEPMLKKQKAITLTKVKAINKPKQQQQVQGFRLMDMTILEDVLSLVSCPECFQIGTLYIEEDHSLKKGLASLIKVACNECDCVVKETYTSNVTNSTNNTMHHFEVNTRSVYAARNIGVAWFYVIKWCYGCHFHGHWKNSRC